MFENCTRSVFSGVSEQMGDADDGILNEEIDAPSDTVRLDRRRNDLFADIKSLNSNTEASVVFINRTLRKVKMLWINHRGELKSYGILKPLHIQEMRTFFTHPWMFVDADTGLCMHVRHKRIFLPSLPKQGIDIKVPIRSLRSMIIYSLASRFKLTTKDMHDLMLPKVIRDDLSYAYQELNDFQTLERKLNEIDYLEE